MSQLVGEKGHVHGVDMTPEQLDTANKWLGWHMEKFFGSPDKVNTTFHQVCCFHPNYFSWTDSIDTGQVFSINPAKCSLFLGMSKGQESRFSAIFDLLYSSSGPQKSQHKSSHKFISLGARNKVTMLFSH